MGHEWDLEIPEVRVWRMVHEVLKPGAHVLAFAGTRTQHRMACNIEDAGFEIRDMIAWLYSSGVPKGLDVGRFVDEHLGAVRDVLRVEKGGATFWKEDGSYEIADKKITVPATDEGRTWDGWNTALKPAFEPVTVARKIVPDTVAKCALEHGTGSFNVRGCRVDDGTPDVSSLLNDAGPVSLDVGKWPANVMHDGSEEVLASLPVDAASGRDRSAKRNVSRFFYCSKASKLDRDEGLFEFDRKESGVLGKGVMKRNIHPTVKPVDLMRWMVRLVTRPGGIVLDPYMGSGSTGKGAVLEGMGFVGIERDLESFEIAVARVRYALTIAGRSSVEVTLDGSGK